MRANVPLAHNRSDEFTTVGEGIHWFENDKWTVIKRVEQIETGIHYAEEPLSRITHMISNVRIVDAKPDLKQPNKSLSPTVSSLPGSHRG